MLQEIKNNKDKWKENPKFFYAKICDIKEILWGFRHEGASNIENNVISMYMKVYTCNIVTHLERKSLTTLWTH